ncbi:uncharacterized protein TNCV_3413581 [Trichonephila clavipes]|uniref:Uncharacterized protein n=1 Tax=Trichonephila clavipes TaxID=2585209 RepID=A0A8X6RLZ1_TRICX|nr:uncharacterized protein TNCV_3413581 [Trichonephila clavipes]
MRKRDRWMQEGTTDQRGRSHPPQCTTSREERQIVCMSVMDRSVTSRTIAQLIESITHHSVSTPFTAEWSVHKTSIAWSTLGAEPQTSPPPMYALPYKQPVRHLRGVGASCPSLPSGPHVSRIVQRFVNNQIELLSWPAHSPDLSPIENM